MVSVVSVISVISVVSVVSVITVWSRYIVSVVTSVLAFASVDVVLRSSVGFVWRCCCSSLHFSRCSLVGLV